MWKWEKEDYVTANFKEEKIVRFEKQYLKSCTYLDLLNEFCHSCKKIFIISATKQAIC